MNTDRNTPAPVRPPYYGRSMSTVSPAMTDCHLLCHIVTTPWHNLAQLWHKAAQHV